MPDQPSLFSDAPSLNGATSSTVRATARPRRSSSTSRTPETVKGSDMNSGVVVYTDGACSGNPGPGGWAWVVADGAFAAGSEPATTNQRMELAAVLDALRSIDGSVLVRSDSTYVVNCFRDGWWKGWLSKGWKNSKREPVANRDLWEPLVALVRSRNDVQFSWVKGHAGDPLNDLADRLAVEAARTQRPRRGRTVEL